MGWSIGFDLRWKRDVGYGVPAICDHPNCEVEIDRGLSFVCGGEPYGEPRGCGLYFCSSHLLMCARLPQLCERCVCYRKPFAAKPDTKEWVEHKLTDRSWAKWRKGNRRETRELTAFLKSLVVIACLVFVAALAFGQQPFEIANPSTTDDRSPREVAYSQGIDPQQGGAPGWTAQAVMPSSGCEHGTYVYVGGGLGYQCIPEIQVDHAYTDPGIVKHWPRVTTAPSLPSHEYLLTLPSSDPPDGLEDMRCLYEYAGTYVCFWEQTALPISTRKPYFWPLVKATLCEMCLSLHAEARTVLRYAFESDQVFPDVPAISAPSMPIATNPHACGPNENSTTYPVCYSQGFGRQWTCADKSRILLKSVDNKWHCIRFQGANQ